MIKSTQNMLTAWAAWYMRKSNVELEDILSHIISSAHMSRATLNAEISLGPNRSVSACIFCTSNDLVG